MRAVLLGGIRAPHRVHETTKAEGRPNASSEEEAIALPPQNGQDLRSGILAPRLRVDDPLTSRKGEASESASFAVLISAPLNPAHVDNAALGFDVRNAIFVAVVVRTQRLECRAC